MTDSTTQYWAVSNGDLIMFDLKNDDGDDDDDIEDKIAAHCTNGNMPDEWGVLKTVVDNRERSNTHIEEEEDEEGTEEETICWDGETCKPDEFGCCVVCCECKACICNLQKAEDEEEEEEEEEDESKRCCEKCCTVVPDKYLLDMQDENDEAWVYCECEDTWYCPNHSPTNCNCGEYGNCDCRCPSCRVDDEDKDDEDDDEDDYKNYGVMAEAEDEEADFDYFDTIEEARIEMIKVVSQDLYERVVIFDTEDYNPDYDNIGTVRIVEEWDEEERMRDERNSMSHEDKPIKIKGLKKKKKK